MRYIAAPFAGVGFPGHRVSADVCRKPHTDLILRRHNDEPPCLAIRGLHKVEAQAAGHRDPRSRIINRLVLRPRSFANLRAA